MNKKKIMSLLLTAAISLSILGCSAKNIKADTLPIVGVTYQTHVQNVGWQNPVGDNSEAGTDGRSLRVEALKINLVNAPSGASIEYQAHVQNVGWQNWVSGGAEAGTDGKSLRVEALRIKLVNMPGYSVQYRAHVQNVGWQNWVSDGQEAGTDGKSLRVEAIEIKIVKISDNSTVGVSYVGHVQNVGWQDAVQNGQIAGTEGKALRVEALKIGLINAPAGASIHYQTHVQNIGWKDAVADGVEGGTDGKSLRVEAIKIWLTGLDGYSVQYRAHVQNIGWQNWVSNGEEAGTDGKSLRVEAIEVRIVKNASSEVTPAVPTASGYWDTTLSANPLNSNTNIVTAGYTTQIFKDFDTVRDAYCNNEIDEDTALTKINSFREEFSCVLGIPVTFKNIRAEAARVLKFTTNSNTSDAIASDVISRITISLPYTQYRVWHNSETNENTVYVVESSVISD